MSMECALLFIPVVCLYSHVCRLSFEGSQVQGRDAILQKLTVAVYSLLCLSFTRVVYASIVRREKECVYYMCLRERMIASKRERAPKGGLSGL